MFHNIVIIFSTFIFISQNITAQDIALIDKKRVSKQAVLNYLLVASSIRSIQDIIRGYLNFLFEPQDIISIPSVHLAYSQDGRYLISAKDSRTVDNVNIYDTVMKDQRAYTIYGFDKCALSREHMVYGTNNSRDKKYSLAIMLLSSGEKTILSANNAYVDLLLFSPDQNYFVSVDLNKAVTIWESNSNTVRYKFTLPGPRNSVRLKFSSDSKFLIIASGQVLKIWNALNNIISDRGLLPLSDGEIVELNFISSTQFFTLGRRGKIRIWGIAKKTAMHAYEIVTGEFILGMTKSSDNGKHIAYMAHNNFRKLTICDTVLHVHSCVKTTGFIVGMQFSPDGKLLVLKHISLEGVSSLRLYSVPSCKLIQEITQAQNSCVQEITFSHDSKQLVMSTEQNTQLLRLNQDFDATAVLHK